MKMIFDTHAHYDDKAFDSDREELLEKLFSESVGYIVNQGTDLKLSEYSIFLAEQYENMYCAVGIHPENITESSIDDIEKIERLAGHPKAVAIGEIGLDYYWDIPKEPQKVIFEKQLILANKLNMPVNVHDREAHGDVLEYLRKYKPKGILHSFSGSVEMAREIVKLGMYIGIGGVVTFKNARRLKEVVRAIPLESIVLETDCPYMAPEPHRGERNSSLFLPYVVREIAALRNIAPETVEETTWRNARRLYRLDRGNPDGTM